MLTSHDTFKDVVAKAVRPNWKALAAEFAAGGLTDAMEKPRPVKPRQTWWKVRKTVVAPTGIGRQAQATSVQFRANAVSPSDRSSSGVLSCAHLTACRPVIRFAQRPVPGGKRSHTGIQHSRLPSGRSAHLFAPALSPAMVGRSPRYDHPAPNPRIVAINTVAAIADQLFHSAPRTKLRDHVWQLPRRRRPMSLTCSSVNAAPPLCRVSA
jgi:hypothetical protein